MTKRWWRRQIDPIIQRQAAKRHQQNPMLDQHADSHDALLAKARPQRIFEATTRPPKPVTALVNCFNALKYRDVPFPLFLYFTTSGRLLAKRLAQPIPAA